jgi:choline dehydrogenase-like flavoprotein
VRSVSSFPRLEMAPASVFAQRRRLYLRTLVAVRCAPLYAYFSSSQGRGRSFTSCWSLVLFCHQRKVDAVQILMLSGIGPAAHLAEHDIPVIAHSPGVGEHLMDHAAVDVAVAETSGTSLNFLKPTTSWHWIKRIYALLTYALTSKGPCTTNVCSPCCAVSPRPTTL